MNPKEPTVYSNRSLAYIKINQLDLALKDANLAIKLDPTFIKAYYRRAVIYNKRDEVEKAIKDYNFILSKDPGN